MGKKRTCAPYHRTFNGSLPSDRSKTVGVSLEDAEAIRREAGEIGISQRKLITMLLQMYRKVKDEGLYSLKGEVK
jgi:predicted DNA binding CopG/RHH family protein